MDGSPEQASRIDAQAFDEALLVEQFRVVVPDLPRLYLAVMTMTVAETLLLWPYTSTFLLAPIASAVMAMSFGRFLYWVRIARDGLNIDLASKRAKLRQINIYGYGILALFCGLGYLASSVPDPSVQTVVLLTIWMCGVGTSFFLFALPDTARNMTIGATAVIVVAMLGLGRREYLISVPMFSAAGYALTTLLGRNFNTFRSAIQSQATVERLRREATALAMTDALTGLANRRAFDDRLAMLCAETKPFAVALIDLDDFKPVNDSYGHVAGDHVLAAAAERMRAFMPRVFPARLGGDEFALLIEDVESAPRLAQETARVLAEPYEVDARTIVVGASCGLAFRMNAKDTDRRTLIEEADAALYRAKAQADRPGDFRVSVNVAA